MHENSYRVSVWDDHISCQNNLPTYPTNHRLRLVLVIVDQEFTEILLFVLSIDEDSIVIHKGRI